MDLMENSVWSYKSIISKPIMTASTSLRKFIVELGGDHIESHPNCFNISQNYSITRIDLYDLEFSFSIANIQEPLQVNFGDDEKPNTQCKV